MLHFLRLLRNIFHIMSIYCLNYDHRLITRPFVYWYEDFLENDWMNTGTCHILNGGCEEICLPEENGLRCECDIGLKLQPDQSCDSGKQCMPYITLHLNACRSYTYLEHLRRLDGQQFNQQVCQKLVTMTFWAII